MKKILALLLAGLLCFSLCACGGSIESNDSYYQSNLTPENTIKIEGKKYSLPTAAENLLNNGWEIPEYAQSETLDPEEGASYVFPLYHKGKIKIASVAFFNSSDSEKNLDACDIISIELVGLSREADEYPCSFSLPGGITEDSTYEDVLNAYGTEEQPKEGYRSISDDYRIEDEGTELFEKYGFSVYIYADSNSANPYNYVIDFNADKTICGVRIDSKNYRNSALSAFDNIGV